MTAESRPRTWYIIESETAFTATHIKEHAELEAARLSRYEKTWVIPVVPNNYAENLEAQLAECKDILKAYNLDSREVMSRSLHGSRMDALRAELATLKQVSNGIIEAGHLYIKELREECARKDELHDSEKKAMWERIDKMQIDINQFAYERDKAIADLQQAREELGRMKEALEFYADRKNHTENLADVPEPAIVVDMGHKAREALDASIKNTRSI